METKQNNGNGYGYECVSQSVVICDLTLRERPKPLISDWELLDVSEGLSDSKRAAYKK